ncbi:conserved exported hypothetical protein [uncultured Desulfatiglans sp.]|uniref:DUF4019 domain-containing protein n=1 Tax=Uncultured Desulfatiglans sp. TaxID=1748965 RepID=A0A653AEU7_UNCDX|nr:conserved exported hypothetical protein [uncultured Desulfatiglans sp.]
MRTVFVLLMIMLMVCFGFNQLMAETDSDETAVSAAEKWLSIIDAGGYSDSWNQASAYFRGAVTQQNWTALLEGVRKPLGKLVNRNILNAQESRSLPGAPDARYMVMFFKAAFAQKESAVETVTFVLDDGKWKAAGYFIR